MVRGVIQLLCLVLIAVSVGCGPAVNDRQTNQGTGGGTSGSGGGSSSSLIPAAFACDVGTSFSHTCIEYSYAAIDPRTLADLRAACGGMLLSNCSLTNSLGACRMTIVSNGVTGTSTTRYYSAPGTTASMYQSGCSAACSAASGTATGCTWLN